MAGMGPSAEQIVAMLGERRKNKEPQLEAMRRVRDAYNGDIVIPLPELDRNELPAVINFVNTGLDQLARRVSSVTPDVFYPPLRDGIQRSMELARTRRRANLAWWRTNKMDAKLARRSRYLMGYAESPVLLRPNAKWGIAKWETRNPLSTYPCPTGDTDDIVPLDCIFTFHRTYAWLTANYPEQTAALNTGTRVGDRCDPAERFDMVEYGDADCTVLIALGKNMNPMGMMTGTSMNGRPFVELERQPNRAGMPLAVVPQRITLDRPMGQFDGMIGMYQTMAKLTALEIIAVERGIFPETYLLSRPNETARFLAGPFDGRSGMVNIVAGGDIREVTPNPGFASTNVVDRIERAARATGGVAAEFTGESPTNVRTGKRGDAVMGAIVDTAIQEAQLALAASLQEENRIAVAIAKAYFGNQRKSFFVTNAGKDSGPVDYVPNQVFETDVNIVNYPLAGSDVNGLMVGLGQRVASGIMSAQTAAEIDPLTNDPELERRRVLSESLDRAMLQGVEAQAQNGMIPPHFVARLKTLVLTGMSLEDAMDKVQKEAQQLQSQASAVAPGAPEAQPGIAQPGAGAEAPAIQGPNSSQDNLAMLLNSLRRPQRLSPGEQGQAA